MLNRTNVGLGIAALALLVAAPLAAVETPETETATPSATIEFTDLMACGSAAADGEAVYCPASVRREARREANAECMALGGGVGNFSVDCWHIGGGMWYYRADVRCTGVR
ncbi:hypothetical protein [Candidatus Palauibacter sp.]|uniref:hypothetical protein n=1 Tax=Candidatus Palauibacter sp. TaxID=3101350 RepID=UPI003B0241EA